MYKRNTENAVLVSYGCCNKLPQTGWLKTTEIYCLTVLEAGSLKSRYWQGHAPSETNREILPCLLLASGGLPGVFGIPWYTTA